MSQKTPPAGVAIVTGAAGGMGAPSARQLAEGGWTELLLCDLHADRLEAVAAPLRAAGAKVDILTGDISAPDYPAKLAAAIGDRPVSAVIHTAGISPTMGDAAKILKINIDGSVALIEVVRPRMAEGGAAVLFASMASHMPLGEEIDKAASAPLGPEGSAPLLKYAVSPQAAYPISKRAVRALVARESAGFGQRKARILSLSPGLIDTGMGQQEYAASPQTTQMLQMTPAGRLGDPEELAAVAVFLCSPGASYMSGCDVRVDGGTTAALGLW
jgi:NAD(P)-dependent dehydrogenase (short-subunit alcohol dehydrogenase family)